MKKSCIGKMKIALFVLLLTLCILPVAAFALTWSTVEPYYEDDDENSEASDNKRYYYTVTQTINGEPIALSDPMLHYTVENNIVSFKHVQYDHSENWEYNFGVESEFSGIFAKFKGEVGYKAGADNAIHVSFDLAKHNIYYIYELPIEQPVTLTFTKTLQERSSSNPDVWNDISSPTTYTKSGTRRSKKFTDDIVSGPHTPDPNQPIRNVFFKLLGHYCTEPGCNEQILIDYSDHTTCDYEGATCLHSGVCKTCEELGPLADHVYSLDDYENIDENVTHFFCIWRNEGCTAFLSHTHIPQSDGTPVDFLDEYDIIPNDVQCHLHYCLASEECVNTINGNKCPFKRKSKVGILELHPGWTTLIDKPATCFEDGCIIQTCELCSMEIETTIPAHGRHDYDYKNPKPVAYNVVSYYCLTPGCVAHIEHSHNFTSDGLKPTNDTRIIPDDYYYHERKYVERKECDGEHCDETRTVETWKEEAHPWRYEVIKDATCLKDGSITHICAGCEMVETIPIMAYGSHDPDYDNPQVISEDEIRYPCKRSGCNEIAKFHFHTFSDDGDPKPQNKYLKITGDNKNHKRLYLQPRKCSCGETRDFEKYIVESHSDWILKEQKTEKCLEDGYVIEKCTRCGMEKTTVINARGGHTYDYAHPENPSANPVKFPCIYGCPGVYATHSHSYVDAGEAAVKTDNTQKNNATYHKRQYGIRQVCNQKLGNGATCGATKWRYDWRDEIHSFANNGSETKTGTLRTFSDLQHEMRYTQAQKCTCGESKTLEIWKKEKHSYTNNGDASSTSSYRQISGNTSTHQRKYLQSKRCACNNTKTEDVWQNERHTYVQMGETHGNCVTPTVKGYKCKYCSMTKSENGAKDPNVHANLATQYVTITNPTCYNDGTGYYPCNACGGRVPTTIKAPGYHTWTVWMITQYPQGNANGTQKRTCRVCGKVESKSFR